MENDMPNHTKTHDMIRWKSGDKVDPRLLTLLESFGEVYVTRQDFFKKIFYGGHEEVFEKIGYALNKKKEKKEKEEEGRRIRRCRSSPAINQRGIDDGIDGLKVERFKVRTPNVMVEDGQEGQPKAASK